MEEIEPVHIILMGNTKNSNDKMIEHVFDLKGSFINREVKGKNLKNTATLKDLNLLDNCKEKIVNYFTYNSFSSLCSNSKIESILMKS